MNDKLHILILDDDTPSVNSLKDSLSPYLINTYNLGLNYVHKDSLESITTISDKIETFDIIIVDYKLRNYANNNQDTGVKFFIDNIHKFDNIPIVFYSSEKNKLIQNLKNILQNEDINYILNNLIYIIDKNDLFKNFDYSFIDKEIKRIESPEHYRGFVLSLSSELENKLYDILKDIIKYYTITSKKDMLPTFYEKLYESAIKEYNLFNQDVLNIEELVLNNDDLINTVKQNIQDHDYEYRKIDNILKDQFKTQLPFFARLKLIYNLLRNNSISENLTNTFNKDFRESFKKNIIDVRNNVAHNVLDDINKDYLTFRHNYYEYKNILDCVHQEIHKFLSNTNETSNHI